MERKAMKAVFKAIAEGESEEVEFKEDSKETYKKIAKEISALANTNGGLILIGVSDKGEVVGIKRGEREVIKKISDSMLTLIPKPRVKLYALSIEGKKIVVVEVERSRELVAHANNAYIRIGTNIRPLSIQEIISRMINERRVHFDEMVSALPLTALQKKLIEEYIKLRQKKGLPGSIKDLEKMGLAKGKSATNGGVLLFYSHPQKLFPLSVIRIVRWDINEEKMEVVKEIEGSILEQLKEALYWVEREVKEVEYRSAGRRISIKEYPLVALREAIINAVAHKNYAISSPVYIAFYPSKIVITNPGLLPPNILEHPHHLPTNPIISEVLWVWGYIEAFGTGIKKIKKECERHPLVEVEFYSDGNVVEVSFIKKSGEDEVLMLLSEPKSSSEIARALGISKPTVLKLIKPLLEQGLVKAVGKGKGRKYVKNA